MEQTILAAALAAAGLCTWLLPRLRLQRVLARPLPPEHVAILRANVAPYDAMSNELKQQLHRLVQTFLHQKKFIGCDGLEVSDEMRLTVAGQACLLLLNRASKVYPSLHTILIYPGAFLVPRNHVDQAGVVTPGRQDLLGESWSDGRVVLSWDHVRRGAHGTPGQNVVLHEFAHQLDSESGSNNGAPFLGDRKHYENWSTVLARDFEQLRRDAMYQQQSVIDHYGASSPAEFFAVATETFFEKPWAMAERHPALYGQFQKYYRVDPRAWMAEPLVPDYSFAYGQWQ